MVSQKMCGFYWPSCMCFNFLTALVSVAVIAIKSAMR